MRETGYGIRDGRFDRFENCQPGTALGTQENVSARRDVRDCAASGVGWVLHRCSEMPIQSYRDLEAWQIGMDFVVGVYAVTKSFPREV